MRSPEDMKIIEIDITNVCIHNCSNCTRMCGHHKNKYFMDWETFRRAVDSLEGFQGGIGIIGGEPTLHPEFERFADYVGSKYGGVKDENYFIQPTANFMRDRKLEERNLTITYSEKNGLGQRIKGPVLFSSISSNYHKHYEVIQDVFCYQGVNDHIVPCFHQPVLVSRKDMGIPDAEWYKLREACWVQNRWSASVTPKGCFFCEIAGTLDMLFDGPGGWPIEAGWWKRKPEDFGEQMHWCELCGIALNTKSRNANEGIDDVSPSLYKKLEEIGSAKVQKGEIYVYTERDMSTNETDNRKFDYHDNNMNRLAEGNSNIYPVGFSVIYIAEEGDHLDEIKDFVAANREQALRMALFVEESMLTGLERTYGNDRDIVLQKRGRILGEDLNKAHKILGKDGYSLLLTAGVRLAPDFAENMKKYVINPGTLHHLECNGGNRCSQVGFSRKSDCFILYSPRALALKKAGFDRIAHCKTVADFAGFWEDRKTVLFDDKMLAGREIINEMTYSPGYRYVVYGTGTYGKKAHDEIKEAGGQVVFFCDSDLNRQGKQVCGLPVCHPDELKAKKLSYDKVVIAALAYRDIRDVILKSGLTDREIVAPIF